MGDLTSLFIAGDRTGDYSLKEVAATDRQRWLRAWEESGIQVQSSDDDTPAQWQNTSTEQAVALSRRGEYSVQEEYGVCAADTSMANIKIASAMRSVQNASLKGPSVEIFFSPEASCQPAIVSTGGNNIEPVKPSIVQTSNEAQRDPLQSALRRWFPEINIHVAEHNRVVDIVLRDFVNRDHRLEKLIDRIRKFLGSNGLTLGILIVNGKEYGL